MMKFLHKYSGHLLILTVVIIFAANIPITKKLLDGHISPFGITALRATFGCVAFWIVSLVVGLEKVAKKDHLILIFGGVTGIILRQVLFVIGLQKSSPIDAAIIISSSPLFAMLIAAIVLKELITLRKIGGIVVGGLGASILAYSDMKAGGGKEMNRLISDLFMMGSALSYAFYLVMTKPITQKYTALTLMKWMFTYAALSFVPFYYKEMIHAPIFHEANHSNMLLLLYPLFVATFIAYLMIPMAQKRIKATTIAMYHNMQPVIASAIAIAVGMDHLGLDMTSLVRIISVLLVLGVFIWLLKAILDPRALLAEPIWSRFSLILLFFC